MIRTMTIKGFESYLRQGGAVMERAAKAGALSGALRSLTIVQMATRQAGAVNTGELLRRWKAERTETGSRILNSAPYSGNVEDGRRAGARMPPRDAIARWAQRKLGLSREEALRAAWPLAKKIAEKGIKPRLILMNQFPKITQIVVSEISSFLMKALREGKGL